MFIPTADERGVMAMMRAERLADGQIKLSGPVWHEVFGEERRLPWARWYRQMYEDCGAPTYLQAAEALEALGDP
ncbi:hypothetical protein [Thalassovita mediterranea]|nr:hypothetical protein [Thalassovita mediterranea]